MARRGIFCGLIAVLLLSAMPGHSEPVNGRLNVSHGLEGDRANPPFGYVAFCEREPEQCRRWKGQPQALSPTAQDWATLNDINHRINARIVALTDEKHYGVREYWTYPDEAGDCEDFVLLKRRVLMDLGFPENALLITVVRDEKGEGHAVLTFATTEGDFILDNRRNDVRRWSETQYSFLKRQSINNPDSWVSLADEPPQPTVASAQSSGAP